MMVLIRTGRTQLTLQMGAASQLKAPVTLCKQNGQGQPQFRYPVGHQAAPRYFAFQPALWLPCLDRRVN